MEIVKILQTRGIVAIHCSIHPDAIECGLLFLNRGHDADATLIDPDTGETYPVTVPTWWGWDKAIRIPRR